MAILSRPLHLPRAALPATALPATPLPATPLPATALPATALPATPLPTTALPTTALGTAGPRTTGRQPRTARGLTFLLLAAACTGLVFGQVSGAAPARAAGTGPCDIFAAANTPCVAAHSTVRALFGAYNGPLYQIRRASDGTTTNINTLSAGGFANAAAQNSFCAGTSCTITEIFDQTANHNNLTVQGPGGNGGQDVAANAMALPVNVGGHQVYGVYVSPGVGYRNNATLHVPTGSAPQDAYMVASGQHVNGGCCFDYGNAETNSRDNGNGHMDAINWGTECWFPPCTGGGPWVQADLENGLFAGANGNNPSNTGVVNDTFVTALLKNNGTTTYAIKGGNAQSGGLTTFWNGALPNLGGYAPMHQEGAIILGTGGDNSNSSAGSFFEGVMTAGAPSDATDTSVQNNVVAAGYNLQAAGSAGLVVAGDKSSVCMDNNNASPTPGNKVQMWVCDGNAGAQNWTMASNGTIQIDGGCLDVTGKGTANGTLVEWWTCNGGTNQVWTATHGELVNPVSGKCLDDPGSNTANGTQLIIFTCNVGANQQWTTPAP